MRRIGLAALILASAAVLVAWNGSRFAGSEQRIRTKDLSFLPSPEVARALACGHANTVARLRWIDSFAYLQLQFDRKDDTVAGGGSGFAKLYDTLIALDPRFQPFYAHASLCLGGVVGRHQQELAYLMRGIDALPHSSELWRMAAAVLVGQYRWDERQPQAFDAFLTAWEAAETTDSGKYAVARWKQMLGRRKFAGLEQLPYWLDRLRALPAGTPLGDYVEGVVREQVASYGQRELRALAEAVRARGGAVASVEDVLDPALITARGIAGQWGPIGVVAGRPVLRPDPWGYRYALVDGAPTSPGLAYALFRQHVDALDRRLREHAIAAGAWPATLAEVDAALDLPVPPAGAQLGYRDQHLQVVVPEPTEPVLAVRQDG